jgi:hypothetical protein
LRAVPQGLCGACGSRVYKRLPLETLELLTRGMTTSTRRPRL